jgi:hypothetical protein
VSRPLEVELDMACDIVIVFVDEDGGHGGITDHLSLITPRGSALGLPYTLARGGP